MNQAFQSIFVLRIIFVCAALDQATKWLAKKYLAPDGFFSFAGDTVRLHYAENTGAFLSLGSSLPGPWRHIILTILVGIFLLALLAYLFFNRDGAPTRVHPRLLCHRRTRLRSNEPVLPFVSRPEAAAANG